MSQTRAVTSDMSIRDIVVQLPELIAPLAGRGIFCFS
jgi:hypothetical protein